MLWRLMEVELFKQWLRQSKYRLMDIRLVFSNTVIFIVVYALVLGVPFYFGYKYHQWKISTWAMLVLATVGPIIFNFLRGQAEDKILEQQDRYQKILTSTSKNLNRLKTLPEIIHLISSILYKIVRLKSVALYLREGDGLVIKKTQTREDMYQAEITNEKLINWLTSQNQIILLKEIDGKNNDILTDLTQNSPAELAVPLVQENRLVGLVLLGEKRDGTHFSDRDLVSFDQMSDQVAMTIEHAIANALYLEVENKQIEEQNKHMRQSQLDRFASSMAHQIRNPLSIILGALDSFDDLYEKVKTKFNSEDLVYYEKEIKNAKSCCVRISNTINTILNFGRGTIDLRNVKVSEVLDGFDILKQLIIKQYGAKLSTEVEENLPLIQGDAHLIDEALIIYLDNSCQAVSQQQDSKKINLNVYRLDPEHVRFCISDNGHGIDPKVQEAIFDVSTSTKGSTVGNGLGLWRVRKVCELMSGSKYGFYSEGRGKGAKFWIDLMISNNT